MESASRNCIRTIVATALILGAGGCGGGKAPPLRDAEQATVTPRSVSDRISPVVVEFDEERQSASDVRGDGLQVDPSSEEGNNVSVESRSHAPDESARLPQTVEPSVAELAIEYENPREHSSGSVESKTESTSTNRAGPPPDFSGNDAVIETSERRTFSSPPPPTRSTREGGESSPDRPPRAAFAAPSRATNSQRAVPIGSASAWQVYAGIVVVGLLLLSYSLQPEVRLRTRLRWRIRRSSSRLNALRGRSRSLERKERSILGKLARPESLRIVSETWLEELEDVDDVGPAMAARVRQSRISGPPRLRIDRLMNVPGIGEGRARAILQHLSHVQSAHEERICDEFRRGNRSLPPRVVRARERVESKRRALRSQINDTRRVLEDLESTLQRSPRLGVLDFFVRMLHRSPARGGSPAELSAVDNDGSNQPVPAGAKGEFDRASSSTRNFGRPAQAKRSRVPQTDTHRTAAPGDDSGAKRRACWIPAGQEVVVRGRSIPDGMLYCGEDLSRVSRYGTEPALIDPRLPIDDRHSDPEGDGMGYWPSYESIPAGCRAAYLHWLAGGRRDSNAYIGYVFLYFYGLERRALHDASGDADLRVEAKPIIAEVERLLSIYGNNKSFLHYASDFLELLKFRCQGNGWNAASPPRESAGRNLPLSIRVKAGMAATRGEPLGVEWALAWVICDPEITLRTPAVRCREEFEELFRRRYGREHGAGIRLKSCKRRIRIRYRPASASFDYPIDIETRLPDVTGLVGPRRVLSELAVTCCEDLDSYSRWIGKHPGRRNDLAAMALLPVELLASDAPDAFQELRSFLDERLNHQESGVLRAAEVLGPWFPADDDGKLSKRKAVEAVRLLGQAGFGVEPDPRFGGPRLTRDDNIVVFRIAEDRHDSPTAAYSAAAVLLQIATAVSAADGEISNDEQAELEKLPTRTLQLENAERRRLAAHLRWLIAQPPKVSNLKKRLEPLTPAQRKDAGRFLVQIAWADGRVDPQEVRMLTRMFRLLELDPASVHSEIHRAHRRVPADSEPVTVQPAADIRGYSIPRADSAARTAETTNLDMAKIHDKIAETAAVSALLSGIFVDDDDGIPVTDNTPPNGIRGLDVPHSRLLERIGERREWSRDDYEDLSESLSLLPDGALDALNDLAFEYCDAPLTEGDDPIEVDLQVHQELMK